MDRSLAPLPSSSFGASQARHLLRRTGFGATDAQADELVKLGPEGAADWVVSQLDADDAWPAVDVDADVIAPLPPEEQRRYTRARQEKDQATLEEFQQRRNEARRRDYQMLARMRRWWLERMIGSSTPLRESLVLLWHGHFAARHRDVRDAYLLYQQNETFRRSPAQFDVLARAIVRDPAMLRFLNNDRNQKRKPNENLSRELMELFTLGVGNYTEVDIQQGARALTGYHVSDNDFVFRDRYHDEDAKTILGQTREYDGDALVDLLLKQDACPRFVALKLYDHFVLDVADHPELASPASRIVMQRLGEFVARHDFDLRPVMRRLFASRHFYDPGVVGNKVKSPAMLVAGTARSLGTPPRDLELIDRSVQIMGQHLFDPPSVAGWPGGAAWINTSTLFNRQNATAYLITGVSPQQRGKARAKNDYDPMPLLATLGSSEPKAVVDHLVDRLVGEHVPPSHRAPLVAMLNGRDVDRESMTELLLLITAMPEYQLC